MRRIATAESLADIGHLKNVLEQNGIRCTIKNEQLSGALGEVPVYECLPELWVIRDVDAQRAEALIAELRTESVDGPNWRCTHCHEDNEFQFAACWNCGRTSSED